MSLLIRWVVFAGIVIAAAYLVPGVDITVPGAFVLVLVLGALNIFLKPILLLLTLPLTILTLGLFALIINVSLVLLAAYIVPGVSISGFIPALLFSLLLSVFHIVLNRLQ